MGRKSWRSIVGGAAFGAAALFAGTAGASVQAPSKGGSASADVTAKAPAASATDKDNKPLHFYGLGLDVSFGDTSGLYAGMEAYQNDGTIELDPSWKIGKLYFKDMPALKKLRLGGRFILGGEFSGTGPQFRTGIVAPNTQFQGCDDSAPSEQGGVVDTSNVPYCQGGSERRIDYTDLTLKLSDMVYTIPVAKIKIEPSITTLIPFSAESRAQGHITSLEPELVLSRDFFNKKLTIAAGFAYAKHFYSTNTPVFQSDYEPSTDPVNPGLAGNAVSHGGLDQFSTNLGPLNPSYSIAAKLDVSYAPTDKLTFEARYVIADEFKYALPECNVQIADDPQIGSVNVCQTGQAVAANSGATTLTRGDEGTQQFWLSADYQFTDWFDAGLAFITVSPQRHPDDSWEQPFFTNDYRNYSTLNLSLTFTTEAIAADLLHKS